ncbi:MAG: hypothetical protein LBT89_01975, partial [Planctomycetaceae bacterium]|nr:hypothetical protein [Planctomycetaceae bacterium]
KIDILLNDYDKKQLASAQRELAGVQERLAKTQAKLEAHLATRGDTTKNTDTKKSPAPKSGDTAAKAQEKPEKSEKPEKPEKSVERKSPKPKKVDD